MPDPRPTSDTLARGSITRRQGLVGVLALGGVAGLASLAACSSSAGPDGTTAPVPTEAAVSPTVADELSLIARYDATIAAFPALASGLTVIREQHAEHLSALGAEGSAAGSPAGSAGTTISLPTGSKAAVGALIDAERSAMRQRVEACVAATDSEEARMLTFIAASEGSHIPALKDLQP